MATTRAWQSFAATLTSRLDALGTAYNDVLARSTIVDVNWNQAGDIAVVIAPGREWGADAALEQERARLLRDYDEVLELLRLLHRDALPARKQLLDETDEVLRKWLVRPDVLDWSVPASIAEAQSLASARIKVFRDLLSEATSGRGGVLAVPDTNVLLGDPDVGLYGDVLGADEYTAVLVPAVLGELDALKNRGRTSDVRDAADRAVRRIKGLRDRGDLRRGVRVQGRIMLRAEPREVPAGSVLAWLDPSVPDDRLLASALDVQVREPASVVVLVTRDVNLQNKAAVVGMPFVDPPKKP